MPAICVVALTAGAALLLLLVPSPSLAPFAARPAGLSEGSMGAPPRSLSQVGASISVGEVILRVETLLWNVNIESYIDHFVGWADSLGVQGVSVGLKRADVSSGLGHLYFSSSRANTVLYTGQGYQEVYLMTLLSKLRARGIKTYAWWPVFNDAVLAESNASLAQHSRDWNSGSLTAHPFVSPHSTVAREHELAMLDEILTKPGLAGWDGVRLDYIRFRTDDDDFSPAARQAYQQSYGQDPLYSVHSKLDTQWIHFRRNAVTSFLQEAKARIEAHGASLDVGGYFLPFPAHPQGFSTYPGAGNDFTQYHQFGFRVMPMLYWQDWASSSNFVSWMNEKMYWSVTYTTDTPAVWPTLSITTTGWCGSEECHRQHLRDALLVASAKGQSTLPTYEARTVSMFFYSKWTDAEWQRLSGALADANALIAGGGSTTSPSSGCPAVPQGYTFVSQKDAAGSDIGSCCWRDIPLIAATCNADSSCAGFNSNGWYKSSLSQPYLDEFAGDPCLGLYVKDPTTTTTTDASTVIGTTATSITATTTTTRTTVTTTAATTTTTQEVCPEVPTGYLFLQQMDSAGNDISNCCWRDILGIAAACNADSTCKGFNSNGWYKSNVQEQQTAFAGQPCLGLYVKVEVLPGTTTTVPVTTTPVANNCPAVPPGYTFTPHMDSSGHDLGNCCWREIASIASECNALPNCAGFNSNGWYKSSVSGPYTEAFPSDPCLGLYTRSAGR